MTQRPTRRCWILAVRDRRARSRAATLSRRLRIGSTWGALLRQRMAGPRKRGPTMRWTVNVPFV